MSLKDTTIPWGKNMNWNYDSLPGCDTMEKNVQTPFPYCGANCNPKNNKPVEGKEEAKAALMEVKHDKCVPWGKDMNWNYDTLPGCDTFEKDA